MIPDRYTLSIIGGKRERNGGRCFQKWNASFPKAQEQLEWVLCAVYCVLPIQKSQQHLMNPGTLSHSMIVTNEI
jgi:hypothetical protein